MLAMAACGGAAWAALRGPMSLCQSGLARCSRAGLGLAGSAASGAGVAAAGTGVLAGVDVVSGSSEQAASTKRPRTAMPRTIVRRFKFFTPGGLVVWAIPQFRVRLPT